MTIFARLLSLPAASRRTVAARGAFLVAGILTIGLLLVAPAGAVVSTVGSTTVGLQPPNEETFLDGSLEGNALNEIEEITQPVFANKSGNPVLHGSAAYLIYWDPTFHYHDDWKEKIDEFMRNVGSASNSLGDVLAVDTQYTDKTNQPAYNRVTFRGAAEDTEAYPTTGNCTDPHPLEVYEAHHSYPLACVTDEQVREQLQHYIAVHALPKGMNTIYYMLTPPGLTVCLDKGGATGHCSDFTATKGSYANSFCSYHGDINPGNLATGDANTVLYSVIPWTAGGLADGQLAPKDETQASYCQDGGFNPTTEPIEQHEGTPVQQEPNQLKVCPPGPDGFCDTGLADLIVNQIAVEQQNTVTDPLLNAWQDPTGNEATDECRNFFAPAEGSYAATGPSKAGTLYNQTLGEDHYYVNTAFNLAALRLVYPGVPCISGVRLQPKFTSPNPVNAGDIVSFDGMESDITLNSAYGYNSNGEPDANYATYKWNFGDGSAEISGFAPGAPVCSEPWLSPCAASVFHAYSYGGEYQVKLTVTDVGGNTETITKPITVVGPPPPAPASSGSGSPGATGSTGAAGSSGASLTSSTPENVPAPRLTAAFVSRSLKSALGKAGLVVRYSVSEQVAGHFEVLLSSAIARRLGITGAAASGLAPGTPPQTVIAKAILVTQKGGSSVVHIQLSKRTAARMHRLGKVSLMLRLSVRNAASHLPTVTTVLSTATLSH